MDHDAQPPGAGDADTPAPAGDAAQPTPAAPTPSPPVRTKVPVQGGGELPCLHNVDAHELDEHLRIGQFFWLDLEDPSADKLKELGDKLKLHPLTLDDAQTFHERPKIEEFDGYIYLVVYGADAGAESGSPLLREVHMIISGEFVVTIHHGAFQALHDLRTRIGARPIRSEQLLIYKVLDAVVETFFPVLSRVDDTIDEIEETVIANPDEKALKQIFGLKRDLVAMRRVVTPMRDVFARDAERITDLPGMQPDDQAYFRDLYDGLIRVSDLVDSYRDLLSGATDMYLSTVANRQGEVGKQLAIIATIFLPLSFLTGFFGQNFTVLTNHFLTHTWAFWAFGMGGLVVSVLILMAFFRRQRWM